MGRLSGLQAQIAAHEQGLPAPSLDPIADVVEAIKGVQLTVDRGEDYTEAFNNLGIAVTAALKAHGSDLIKAINGIAINVEAPQVTVEAPKVEVKPEFELTLPEQAPKPFSIRFERGRNGVLEAAHVTDYQPTKKPAMRAIVE